MIYTCYCKKNSCEIKSRDDRISFLFRDRNKLPYFWLLKIWKKWNGQRHFLMHLCMKDNIPKTHPDHNSQAFGCFALTLFSHISTSDSHYCKCMRAWLYSISQNSYNTVFYFFIYSKSAKRQYNILSWCSIKCIILFFFIIAVVSYHLEVFFSTAIVYRQRNIGPNMIIDFIFNAKYVLWIWHDIILLRCVLVQPDEYKFPFFFFFLCIS